MRLLFSILVSLVAAARVFGAPNPNPNLESLVAELRGEVQPDQAMDFVRHIYSTDRWFTFPKFKETTDYLQSAMLAIGLHRVERLGAPADGTSQFGYWTEPLAWDVTNARLEIVDPTVPAAERVLTDYQKVPCSLCMWSGATPPGGVTAEVVELKETKPQAIGRLDLRGKLVLTADVPSDIKWALAKAGALGAINTYTENPGLLDGRQWINAWGDDGWAFTKGSAPLLCFSLSPREAALVRRLLAEHCSLHVKAIVNSRYYDGIYPYVTGVIPGIGREEVLTLGHNAEQGAEDNATGVSAMLEAAATLNRLIASGRLPWPRRSIRILAAPEMYGSMHYVATHPERMRRTIAAMTVDTPAGPYDVAGTEYTFSVDPLVASSYVDAFILKIAADYFPFIDLGFHDYYLRKVGRPWHEQRYVAWSDSYLSDPAIGVADVAVSSDSGVETHHNSEDTPNRIDPRSLRDLSVVDATFLYYLANAGEAEALWLAQLSETHGDDMILRATEPYLDSIATAGSANQLGQLWWQGIQKIDFMVGREVHSIDSVERLVPESGRAALLKSLAPLDESLRRLGKDQKARVQDAVGERARLLGISPPDRPIEVQPPNERAASTIVVKRKRLGTIPLDEIRPDRREGYPSGAWDLVAITALYWCDGHRPLSEVVRLTELERGPVNFDFVGYFRFLKEHGYVDFVKRK
ncbi:MAG TPA: M28 family peptidase [Terriglobia bacterium]|nr:M28 family peptidase [Terriglobia bacterium]